MKPDFTAFLSLPPEAIREHLRSLENDDISRALAAVPEEQRAGVWKAIGDHLGSTILSLFKEEVSHYEKTGVPDSQQAQARIVQIVFGARP